MNKSFNAKIIKMIVFLVVIFIIAFFAFDQLQYRLLFLFFSICAFLQSVFPIKIKKSGLLTVILITVAILSIFFGVKSDQKQNLINKKQNLINEELSSEMKELRKIVEFKVEDNFKIQPEKIIEDTYKKELPEPQNWKEAYEQQLEADQEFSDENYKAARNIYLNILNSNNYVKSEELKSILSRNIGATYGNSGNYNEAIAWFNKAKEYKNHQLNVYESLALAYFKLGDYEKAVREYKIMLERDPGDSSISNKLGILYSLNDQHDNAIEQFKIAIDNNFIPKGLYFNLALNYLKKGSKFDKEGIFYLEKERELYPGDAPTLFQLGAAYCWQNECRDKGIKLMEEAVLLDNNVLSIFPEFGLPDVVNFLSLSDTTKISSIKIYPDYVEIEYIVPKQ